MENRKRNVHLHVMVTPDELAAIHERMAEAGISNTGAFRRSLGSFTLSSGFASSSGGVGGMGVLLGTPSIMLQFCSVESSAVFR